MNAVAAEDACVLCGFWRCRCEEVLRTARRLATALTRRHP